MQRSWWVVTMVMAGCSFSGSRGSDDSMDSPDPDAAMELDAAPEPDAPGTGGPASCEDSTEIGGSFYRLLPDPVSRADAVARCAAIPGTHLVTLEMPEEAQAIKTSLPLSVDVWTGVRQRVPLGILGGVGDYWFNYIGQDRTSIPDAFPWHSGEPNDLDDRQTLFEDGEENFAMLRKNGKLDDVDGNGRLPALCECVRRE